MRREFLFCRGFLLFLFAVSAGAAWAAPAGQDAPEPLAIELVEANTIFMISSSSVGDLRTAVEAELEQWGRLELVDDMFDADVQIALEANAQYVSVDTKKKCPEDEPLSLCDRGSGTERVFEGFVAKVFLLGHQESLWSNEVAIEDADEAAEVLIERLKADIEAARTVQADSVR